MIDTKYIYNIIIYKSHHALKAASKLFGCAIGIVKSKYLVLRCWQLAFRGGVRERRAHIDIFIK